jgi:enediyne biosynthesis protein E4
MTPQCGMRNARIAVRFRGFRLQPEDQNGGGFRLKAEATRASFRVPHSEFRIAFVAVVAAYAVAMATSSDWAVSLVDVAADVGLTRPSVYGGVEKKRFIIETNGAGVALVDVDGDGLLDALVLNGTRLEEGTRENVRWPAGEAPTARLYRNLGTGRFADITDGSGLERVAWSSSVCVGDYDNDGRTDLFTTAYGTNALYHNAGGGRFETVTARAGLPTTGIRWGSGCTFIDYDRDGRLDLFVSNYLRLDLATAPEPGQGVNCLWKGIPVNCGPKGLPTDTNLLYHQEPDGTFRDVSEPSGIAAVRNRYPMTAAAADLDDDGWTDIYVASDSTAAILYRNNGDGTFADTALQSGTAFSENGMAQAGMGLAIADVNGDGRLDIVKTHFADDIPALYRSLGKGLFEDVATAVGLAVQNRYVEWGAGMPDLDNDGWPDLVYVTGNVYPEVETRMPEYPHKSPMVVFRNRGGTRFEDVTMRSGPGPVTPRSSRGAAFGDIDNDGDVDVLVMNMNDRPALLRNEYAGPNRWLAVRLEGRVSNRSAIGATVRLTAGGRTQARAVLSQASYYSADDLRLHFGLGTAPAADLIEVRWPNGTVTTRARVPAGQVLTIQE